MLNPGTKVKVINLFSRDFTEDVLHNREKGLGKQGYVIGHHDSHGLCYCVAHFQSGRSGGDSFISYYDPEELEAV